MRLYFVTKNLLSAFCECYYIKRETINLMFHMKHSYLIKEHYVKEQ